MDANQSNTSGAANVKLTISRMTCSGCANTVKRVLSRVPGAVGVEVDLDEGAASVQGTAGGAALVAAVVAAGYDAQLA